MTVLCDALAVSTSAFYAWSHAQSESDRTAKDADLKALVPEVFVNSRRTYGKRRIRRGLLQQVQAIGPQRVSKLMKEEKLMPKTVKTFKQTTDSSHQYPVAPNRLENGFNAEAPNRAWSKDFTYIRTDEGSPSPVYFFWICSRDEWLARQRAIVLTRNLPCLPLKLRLGAEIPQKI